MAYCNKCHRKFATEEALFNHTNVSPNHHVCGVCLEELDTAKLLKVHQKSQHFPCSKCKDTICATDDELKKHMALEHVGDLSLEDEEDKKEEKGEEKVTASAAAKPQITCICSTTFTAVSSCLNHIENGNCGGMPCHMLYHVLIRNNAVADIYAMRGSLFENAGDALDGWVGGITDVTSPPTTTNGNSNGEKTGISSGNGRELKDGGNVNGDTTATGKKYECKGCRKVFERRGVFISHFFRDWHALDGVGFRCEYCAKRFERPSALVKHREMGGC